MAAPVPWSLVFYNGPPMTCFPLAEKDLPNWAAFFATSRGSIVNHHYRFFAPRLFLLHLAKFFSDPASFFFMFLFVPVTRDGPCFPPRGVLVRMMQVYKTLPDYLYEKKFNNQSSSPLLRRCFPSFPVVSRDFPKASRTLAKLLAHQVQIFVVSAIFGLNIVLFLHIIILSRSPRCSRATKKVSLTIHHLHGSRRGRRTIDVLHGLIDATNQTADHLTTVLELLG